MAEAEAATLADYYGMKQTLSQAAEEKPSVSDAATSAEAATWYRVRKTWEDAASQVDAYKVYDNAVRNCPEGYSVFDDAGKVLHRNACSCTHEVKSGDTLGKLAKEYGTTVETIVAANKAKYPKITADHIVVGWKLKV